MNTDHLRWGAAAALLAVLGVGAWTVAARTPPLGEGKIVLAVGNSTPYRELAETYRHELEHYGVQYEVQQGGEGFTTLRELLQPGPGINAAFIKGGLVGSLHGRLASERAKDRYEEFSQLWSVGRVFHEPIWVFLRDTMQISSLRDLKGRKILAGTRDGGTRRIVSQLLKANGVDKTNASVIEGSLPADAAPLLDGRADAAVLIEAPDSELIQSLLHLQRIRLMDFSAEAEAYTNRFPAISRVVLHKGAVEFNPVIPIADTTLLSTAAAIVVRRDMHPALVDLLTHAVISNPRSGFDHEGDPVLFYRAGDFPSADDPEFQIAPESRIIYRTGELPVLLRTLLPVTSRLGLPFAFSGFISNYFAQALLLIVPLMALLIPVSRAVPAIYRFVMRRRILHWYRLLKALERSLDNAAKRQIDLAAHVDALERIDAAVRRLHVPLPFSSELYDLRSHIALVRRRLEAPEEMPLAAE